MDTKNLDTKIKQAIKAIPSDETVKFGFSCMDLTSLTGKENTDTIKTLCDKAKAVNVGGVCIYPKHVRMVADYLHSHDIAVATVINFSSGDKTNEGESATPESTYQSTEKAIADGATEIDIVIDYKSWRDDMSDIKAKELLSACREACNKGHAKMKVIIEVAAFARLDEIYEISKCAIESGADFIKTSTGKHEDGGADFHSVLMMCQALKDTQSNCGLKISGGVNGDNYAQYLSLVKHEMGDDFIKPSTFRFGASGLYDDLKPSKTSKPKLEALSY